MEFFKGSSLPVIISYTVLIAASITPPVVAKISAAPVEIPRGSSNFDSSKLVKSILKLFY
jgi:hypothetical protein